MSATERKDNKIVPKGEKLPVPQLNPSYTVRVICCVLFIFLAEIFLAHYIYRLINSEIKENYLSKHDFRYNFQNEIRTEFFREEIVRIVTYINAKNEAKLNKNEDQKPTTSARKKRSVGRISEYNYLADANTEEPYRRFRSPKVRAVAEDSGGDGKKKPEHPGQGPGDDWIWVSSTSRIPKTP
ncbi:uncharacterized protein LOC115879827 [Sitophilus oryzae]|uniref:Uncharacterized protein LOC115879827 n=1 Tax=Sitophilus oryzae TaxID=7048 RepID=A0A6J2XPW7_SITOR|nr:uncharacterized protein LOC115879827 [Sitophilus oryzae]